MSNIKTTVALVLSIIAVVMAVNLMMITPEAQTVVAKSGAYDRIMKDRVIRCAYQAWPPFIIKDPNTGKIGGVYADLFDLIGHDLSLKIDWVEEVGSATMFEGFKTNRYDMLCSPVTSSPERALVSDFSRPIAYVPFYLYAREGDVRFDNAYEKANSEEIAMMAMDGDFTAIAQAELFPKAKKTALPNMTNGGDILVGIASGKADAAINDPSIAEVFIKNNPGKIKRVAGPPLRFPSLNIAMPIGEDRLRALVDTTLTNYLEVGKVDKILNAYGLDETKILRVAPPYRSVPLQQEVPNP